MFIRTRIIPYDLLVVQLMIISYLCAIMIIVILGKVTNSRNGNLDFDL